MRCSAIYLVLFFMACQEPVELNFKSENEYLVIDGFISDTQGPYDITITRTIPFVNDEVSVFEKIVGASVRISDGNGNNYPLRQSSPGVYRTANSFIGEVGQTYTLNVEIGGELFQSSPQTIPSKSYLDSVYFRSGERETINDDGTTLKSPTVEFLCDVSFQGQNKFVAFTWESAFKFKPGSTFNECYVEEENRGFSTLESNNGISIDEEREIPIGEMLYNFKFKSGFSLNAIVYSMTEEAYDFHFKVNQQRSSTGSVFDPQPFQIFGNIQNITDPNQLILGFFGAYSQVEKRIFVYPSDINAPEPYNICSKLNPPNYCSDCTKFPGANIQKPLYWEDQ